MRQNHQIDHRLSALAVAYGNEATDFIASAVAPRVNSNQAGQYQQVAAGSRFQSARTKIAYGARVGEVYTDSNLVDYVLEDHGISSPVDDKQSQDVDMDRGSRDQLRYEAMATSLNTMATNLESEVRDLIFGSANYASTLRETLSSADQFTASTSNPIEIIRDALSKPLAMPNVIVCGINVFNALASNPAINKAANKNDGDVGFQTAETLATLLGVDRVIVGKAWGGSTSTDTAPSARIWDSTDSCALIRVGRPTSLAVSNSAAFAVTASSRGGVFVRTYRDEQRGLLGSEIVQPCDSRKVLHLSSVAGYLLQDCLA